MLASQIYGLESPVNVFHAADELEYFDPWRNLVYVMTSHVVLLGHME